MPDTDPSSKAKEGDQKAIQTLLGDHEPAGQAHSTTNTDEVPDLTDPVQIDNDQITGTTHSNSKTNADASTAPGGNPA
ncbi:hypothetical protein LTS08_005452 [Lithohypha guttulata]|uniref:Uncharacterized protein n=1 Tax=Lithohypha guttulata TaxID=1690604 RepID=A0AAN7Y7D3_9EURO|nr:hypothetical protein LTR51_003369 [Lithohypha guttulata]KAK5087193.1 hypothetical protein LTR05_004364 [Lithohypha guttulata]KAK5099737.1 hypothetical protein LTS08_005452 [Lithohypha guttulata]